MNVQPARRRARWTRRFRPGIPLAGALALAAATMVSTTGFGQAPATSAPGTAAPAPPGMSPVVVAIDPGHGGTNLGAAGPGRGVFEKNITLAMAERVRTLLAEAPASEISAILCRQSDVMVPIRARARCASESGANLFISLHTNAVPAGVPPGSQRGFEVFVLGPREVEDDANLASAGQNHDADAVWAAHEVRAAAEQSIILGREIARALAQALGAEARRGVKQSGAALDVLRGAGTAAALVEVGFLDHPEEGARLATADGREPIARALVAAIQTYVHGELRQPVRPVDASSTPPGRGARDHAQRRTHPSAP